jgi:hypothetical protein
MTHPDSSSDFIRPTPTTPTAPTAPDALQARFALRVTTRLNEGSQALAPDIGERLRFAREQALARARATGAATQRGRSGTSGKSGKSGAAWWWKLAATLPVIALVAGLILIQDSQTDTQIATAAAVDAALLSDDLPPNAYRDAGFAEFLKVSTE